MRGDPAQKLEAAKDEAAARLRERAARAITHARGEAAAAAETTVRVARATLPATVAARLAVAAPDGDEVPREVWIDALEGALDGLVAHEVERLFAAVQTFVARELQIATLSRAELPGRWPFQGPLAEAMGRLEGVLEWPGEAAPLDVAMWARERLNALAKGAGDRAVEVAKTSQEWLPDTIPADAGVTDGELALLFLTERGVRDASSTRAVKMSAHREAHAVVGMLASGAPPKDKSKPSRWDRSRSGLRKATRTYELVWGGKRTPLQLALLPDETGPSLEGAVVRSILDMLAADGVRDWIVLHRMAGEQGSTGLFRWSWADHRDRTDYARRIASKNATDAQLCQEVLARLWRLKMAELRIEHRYDDGRVDWVRVGDHGLIDIPAGRDELLGEDRMTHVAAIQINARLYAGAHASSNKPLFALVPEAALTLPAMELRLATLLSFQWTYNDGSSRLLARTLWEYAGIRDGLSTDRKRWPDARRALDRALERAGKAIGIDWTVEGEGAEALYTIRAPTWWADRALRGVPPQLPKGQAGVPRTGAELREWRQERGLTLRDLSAAIEVPRSTLSDVENRPDLALPPDWANRLTKVPRR